MSTEEKNDNVSGISEDKLKITPSTSDESTVFGCSLFHIYRNLNVPKWMIGIEIAFRNENIGGNLWVEGAGFEEEAGKGYDQDIFYTLTLFEKIDYDGKVKGGYVWKDKGIHGRSLDANIQVDWESDDLLDTSNNPLPKDEISRSYQKIWIEKKDGKGIFQEIKVKGNEIDKYEILGIENDFELQERNNMGYSLVEQAYDVENKKGMNQKFTVGNDGKSFDLTDTLTTWYKPFKNRKGTWVDSQEYCLKKEINKSQGFFLEICN